ncbi:MAG: hypothetical protein NC041_06470 [Bacteroides sp.]|nr:hypothetical protein [Prevotella sp.]MCM1406940.1 hypothetical protein [Treponema brennaborense]MCM1470091.1 hypothetical protein [Bacteroides sp.]
MIRLKAEHYCGFVEYCIYLKKYRAVFQGECDVSFDAEVCRKENGDTVLEVKRWSADGTGAMRKILLEKTSGGYCDFVIPDKSSFLTEPYNRGSGTPCRKKAEERDYEDDEYDDVLDFLETSSVFYEKLLDYVQDSEEIEWRVYYE